MVRKRIVWFVPLITLLVYGLANAFNSGLATDSNTPDAAADAFVCPITGEELSCPDCCPLSK